MTNAIWFERIPLWAVFICGFVTTLLGITAGFAMGFHRRRKTSGTVAEPVASVAAAMLGLLAFLLAFTFDMSASRFQARRQILLQEVNAIETTFLRADQITEPQRTNCRELLKKYVTVRSSLSTDGQDIANLLQESQQLQDQLWREAVEVAKSKSNPQIDALFISSLNELIDLHTVRATTALQYHIPALIWSALFFLAFLSMLALGYQFGLSGTDNFFIYGITALGFSLTILMIADFDSVTRGSLTVSQQPMIQLRDRLAKSETFGQETIPHALPPR